MDPGLIDALAGAVHGDLEPDCTLLLDLPVEAGLARARSRQGTTATADRFEAENVAFFERVRAAYRSLAAREPGRIRVIDATVPLLEMERTVTEILTELRARGRRG